MNPDPERVEASYQAAFRKADELRWEGEEQFMGELIEIVDAVLDAYATGPSPEQILAYAATLDGAEVLPATVMSDTRYPDAQYDALVVTKPGRYLVIHLPDKETTDG